MPSPALADAFSFESVAMPDRVWLRRTAASIRVRLRKLHGHRMAVGQMLCRSRRRLGHKGAFGAWVRDELGLPRRQATRLMQVWKRFGHLPTRTTQLFDPTALYTLSEPCTPPGVRAEFIERAQAGHFVRGFEVDQRLAADRDQGPGDESLIPKDPKPVNNADDVHAAANWFLLLRVLDDGMSLHLHTTPDEGFKTYHAMYHGPQTRHKVAVATSLEAVMLEIADEKRSKQCTGPCKKAKPLTDFSKRVKNPDGRNDRCKACERERVKIYEAKRKMDADIAKLAAAQRIHDAVAAELRTMLKDLAVFFLPNGQMIDNAVSLRLKAIREAFS